LRGDLLILEAVEEFLDGLFDDLSLAGVVHAPYSRERHLDQRSMVGVGEGRSLDAGEGGGPG
jgi:hypothetical protein